MVFVLALKNIAYDTAYLMDNGSRLLFREGWFGMRLLLSPTIVTLRTGEASSFKKCWETIHLIESVKS